MIAPLFLVFTVLTAAVAVAFCARYLDGRAALGTSAVLSAWLVYVGALSYFGVVANVTGRPPGPVFLFVPVVVWLALVLGWARSPAGTRVARAFPPWVLLGAQTFRVGVELFLHQLWLGGLVPRTLTFAGDNVDVYVGASAPLVAWLSTRGRAGRQCALFWNGLGLLALGNVVVRAVLTAPGPLNLVHAEVPNRMIGTFPFTFVPGFFVPLAVTLHVLALRALLLSVRTSGRGF